MSVSPTIGNNVRKLFGLLTGQTPPKSSFFGEDYLTKLLKFLENRDTYEFLLKMGMDKGKALGAMMLGALAVEPALAEDRNPQVIQVASNVSQQVDCKLLARNHQGTGPEKRKVFNDFRNGVLDDTIANQEAVIAEQQRVLAALNERLAELNLRIDENARILDEQNQELARIVAINGQLVIQIEQTDQQIAQKLQEAERILQGLAAS
jgi:hypothetical protein